jgi:hypothetical protein
MGNLEATVSPVDLTAVHQPVRFSFIGTNSIVASMLRDFMVHACESAAEVDEMFKQNAPTSGPIRAGEPV